MAWITVRQRVAGQWEPVGSLNSERPTVFRNYRDAQFSCKVLRGMSGYRHKPAKLTEYPAILEAARKARLKAAPSINAL